MIQQFFIAFFMSVLVISLAMMVRRGVFGPVSQDDSALAWGSHVPDVEPISVPDTSIPRITPLVDYTDPMQYSQGGQLQEFMQS